MKNSLFFPLLLILLVGCVKLPAPEIKPPDNYLYGEVFSQESLPHDIRWWRTFNDPCLNALEERALRQSFTLAEAAARVEAARQNLRSARAEYLPSISLNLEAEGERIPHEGITQSYSIAPSMSWEISLFGGLRSAKRAAEASLQQSEWAFRGLILSLTSEIATTYFSLLEYEESLRIASETQRLRAESAALIDSMVRYGMKSRIDLDQSRSQLLTAEADCYKYQQLVTESQLSLSILLGEYPEASPDSLRNEGLFTDRLPEQVPVGLPSSLLLRRPDIMQQLFSLDAAAARVGTARAARLPGLSLTIEGGRLAKEFSQLMQGDSWMWSAVGSITQPLFGFGRLKAAERIARENYFEALFAYEASLLEAVSEVEGALSAILRHREQLSRQEELVQLNREALEKSRALYRSGLSDYLDLLDAERTAYESQLVLTSQRAGHFIDYINLYKALGGGW